LLKQGIKMNIRTRFIIPVIAAIGLSMTQVACNSSDVATPARQTSEASGVINISNDELQGLLDKNITLIDIRRPEEWQQTGIVPGSKKLTFFFGNGQVNPALTSELPKIAPADKPVALICRTGNRTSYAAKILAEQLGYKKVYNVKHGITKWIAEGRKTVK
jgi:rhodanese-related sulfurtransferase